MRKREGKEITRKSGRTKNRKSYRLTGSMVARVLAFFLLAITCFVGIGCTLFSVSMVAEEIYTKGINEVLVEVLSSESLDAAFHVRDLLEAGDVEGAAAFCEGRNFDISMSWVNNKGVTTVVWSTWEGYETDLTIRTNLRFYDLEKTIFIGEHVLRENTEYIFNVYFKPDFPENDDCRKIALLVETVYEIRYLLLGLAAGSVFLFISCLIFLLCSAGHRTGREEIVPGVLTKIHFDVLTVGFGLGVLWILYVVEESYNVYNYNFFYFVPVMAVAGTVLAIWLTIYLMDFAARAKLEIVLKHTVIYVLLSAMWRAICFLFKSIIGFVKKIPLVLTTLIVYLGICIVEFMGVALYVESEGVLLWALEKVILLFVVMYIALTCKKLLNASRALAEGQENYRVDTTKMFGEFKEHGENLNSLGQGISKAVSERMKSEHLKTELITNVSHDLKTPLTSIINYADLICEEQTENEKITEYAEVLLRQSGRLKKLVEDLVEASKATTGNLEVTLEPCEAGVLLSQAVGEYQQKMEEKGLELRVSQPEESIKIMADGRHLWRVFDNLLNNICKYAQENTRVYLSVEAKAGKVFIIFRNMSKYALDISPQELEERFVRGDKSRHMEGNGLGLSIAKSLIDLQNGRMEIVTDGDLFKVTLTFAQLED